MRRKCGDPVATRGRDSGPRRAKALFNPQLSMFFETITVRGPVCRRIHPLWRESDSNRGLSRPPWRRSATLLPVQRAGCIPRAMTPIFDMDDRARLPWRFHGATRTVLARA